MDQDERRASLPRLIQPATLSETAPASPPATKPSARKESQARRENLINFKTSGETWVGFRSPGTRVQKYADSPWYFAPDRKPTKKRKLVSGSQGSLCAIRPSKRRNQTAIPDFRVPHV